MSELVLLLIMFSTVAYIAQPYWHKQLLVKNSSNGKLIDLEEKRDSLFAQIKEVEFDHAVGKVSAEDFQDINARYRAEAVEILQRIHLLSGNGKKRLKARMNSEQSKLRKNSKGKTLFCHLCGMSLRAKDRYCPGCGNPI